MGVLVTLCSVIKTLHLPPVAVECFLGMLIPSRAAQGLMKVRSSHDRDRARKGDREPCAFSPKGNAAFIEGITICPPD